jgi:phage/plasmid-associated DNA primase
MITFLFGPISD